MAHEPREQGASGYTFRKLITHAMNMMTGFTTLPLQLASLWVWCLPFWFWILFFVLGRYFMHGGQCSRLSVSRLDRRPVFRGELFALGIIGEYLARMHFRSMQKPPYVVRVDAESRKVEGLPRSKQRG